MCKKLGTVFVILSSMEIRGSIVEQKKNSENDAKRWLKSKSRVIQKKNSNQSFEVAGWLTG